MKHQPALIVVTFLVIGIGLIFIFKTLHLEEGAIVEALTKFHPLYWLGSLVAVVFQMIFQTHRLWVLFPGDAKLRWTHAARAFSYGQFINTFGPTGAGDLLKVVLTRKHKDRHGRQIEASEASAIVLVADKVADVGSVLLLIGLALLQTSFQVPEVPWNHYFSKLKTVLLSTIIIFLSFYLLFRLLRARFKIISHWLKGFKVGLQALQEPKRCSGGLLMGVANWISELIALSILCVAQGYSLSYSELLLSLVILNIGISIPISPANIGVYEASLAFALTKSGIPAGESLAIATVHHLCQMIGTALWALMFWLYERWQDYKKDSAF
ncbi:flippase-like domain-containing protein [Candidatus Gracilibacteria bacterium]|jgi:glycosyltransferase 2 family protein|nr:flippase-like domain-containing protein [Candidatus Gracilibacteria bacterium]NJM86844.1 flippase-like domain-containing protein [Hydrococcus sp. RU_2_2]NJP17878.1 flippase-like domain-containing protein [Hydrococcus sp. CRU_1_1]